MLTLNPQTDTNVLEFTLDGSMTRPEFNQLIVQAEEMIETFDKIRVVEIIKGTTKVTPNAILPEQKWEPTHLKHLTHLAVVTDQKLNESMVTPFRLFINAEIKLFKLNELEDARYWINTTED